MPGDDSTLKEIESPTEIINIFPVPFDEVLRVEIENKNPAARMFTIVMNELSGNQVFRGHLFVNGNSVEQLSENMSSINAGFNVLFIYEDDQLIELILINK